MRPPRRTQAERVNERQLQLHIELDDIANVTIARRRRVNIELHRLATEARRLLAEAAQRGDGDV
ncbi:hypothetical protein [Kitasatospora sp. NPDC050463]|uniref:hypothetical protein n=1 Tax=Kitasatospora sp. NPDC050463 TaxID=3155786 RepID=UPI0033EF4DD7